MIAGFPAAYALDRHERKRMPVRKLISLLLAALMLFGSASAEALFIPETEWQWDAVPLEITLSADVQTHMPFDENRTAQLNNLLKHISLRLYIQQSGDEAWSSVELLTDGAQAAEIRLRQTGNETEAQFSVMRDSSFRWTKESGVSLPELLGGDKTAYTVPEIDPDLPADALALFESMVQSMPEYLTDKAHEANISGMGKAVRKQTLTIPSAQADGLGVRLASLCPKGRLRSLLESTVYAGKQTLMLWRGADGSVYRVEWTGQAGASADDLRKVSLVWRLRHTDRELVDEITLKTPKVKGSGRNNLQLERRLIPGEYLLLTVKTDVLSGGEKSSQTLSADLKRRMTDGGALIEGEASIEYTVPDSDMEQKLVLRPEIMLTGSAEAPALSGKTGVTVYSGKNPVEQAELDISVRPSGWLLWELRPDVTQVTEDNLPALAQTITGHLTVDVVRRMVLLPQEDTLFISDGLDPVVWNQIVEAARSALQ